MITKRKAEEKQFHDELRTNEFGQRWSHELEHSIGNNPLWANMKYYSVERKSRALVAKWFSENCKNAVTLDYCCGNGDDAFEMIKSGAQKVYGIDISDTSIRNCQERAVKEKHQADLEFSVMDAELLEFDENSFDIISEYGVLHHLNLQKAYKEMARVLKPNGKCLCVETLGHNPIIHMYRKMTPHLRTKWEVEHILKKEDIYIAKQSFHNIEVLGFFHLFTLAAVPFRNTSIFFPILKKLEKIDSILLKLPYIKWQAWQTVFLLSDPIK